MYHQTKLKTKIISSGCFLPPQIVKSDDLMIEIDSERQYGIPVNWISEKMGIVERRVSSPDQTPSDLAIPAAQQAIINAGDIELSQIDMVVFCGIERDQPEPATAHTIADKLGIQAKHCFDVSNACYGFVDGMQIADAYVGNCIARAALVVTGEIPTRVLDAAVNMLKRGVDKQTARNIIGALSVGDAGGAVVIAPVEPSSVSGFELFNVNIYPDLLDKCIYKKTDDGKIDGQMVMGPIAHSVVKFHSNIISDTLKRLGWDQFDWLISHQIGQKPFDRMSRMQGVNHQKMTKTIDRLGNITSASFPVNFHNLSQSGHAKPGDRIGGCFAGSGLTIGQFGYVY